MVARKNNPINAAGGSGTSDREIVISRVVDAPRELVWEAMTNPLHVVHWWGPRGFTTTIQKMDVQPGGVWEQVMHSPDGVNYPGKSIFKEVVRPERIVYKLGGGREGAPSHQFVATWTFDALEAGRTKVTIRMVFPSAAVRDRVVKEYGAIEGGKQTLERLEEHLPKMNPAIEELVITRLFDAPRALVFKAWTDPKRLKKWWGPKKFTNPVCEADPRQGGAVLIHMRGPEGTVYPMTGAYREIAEPERLVFTSGPLDEKGNQIFEVLTTVTFAENAGKTTLTLRARVIWTAPEGALYIKGMKQGWTQSLDRLAEEVARP